MEEKWGIKVRWPDGKWTWVVDASLGPDVEPAPLTHPTQAHALSSLHLFYGEAAQRGGARIARINGDEDQATSP